ncbi:MAG: TOTE conflict system archaeo-eukaryotic primase domain-containing protein [Ktedonobacteraceae bacterium]
MFTSTDAQAQLLANFCLGRLSDYAVQEADGHYRRVGAPITLTVMRRHLDGVHTIGTYLMDEQGYCFFAVFDADQENGLHLLAHVQERLEADGIHSYLEASRRGGHLWVFLTAPVPAWAVRRWLLPYCPAGVEFYPKQDHTSNYGSLMRVPLGIHRRSGKRYAFLMWRQGRLVPVGLGMEDVLVVLAACERVTVPPDLSTAQEQVEREHLHTQSQTKNVPQHPSVGYTTIADWCAAQDPFDLIGNYVRLDSRGLGQCPFGEHHRNGTDLHPSFQVYQPKRPGGGCWRCYTGEVSGNVFNFLQLYRGLTAAALWAQLRSSQPV